MRGWSNGIARALLVRVPRAGAVHAHGLVRVTVATGESAGIVIA